MGGRGHHAGEHPRVDGGRSGVYFLHCLSRAALRLLHVALSRCHRVEYLLMPKAVHHAPPPRAPLLGWVD